MTLSFAYLIEPPFNYHAADGTVTGCDVELARHVLGELGIADVAFIEAEFAELLPGVADGRWRMTTGLFSTEERRKNAAFSRPIWALPDGLLVQRGNPLGLTGYRSAAASPDCVVAVIRDQIQHRAAEEFGIPAERIRIFETYTEAALAVQRGEASAYASVARAHAGFLELHADIALDIVTVPASEKQPAFGSFGFNKADDDFRRSVDAVLEKYIGSAGHRAMMAGYGFSDQDIDLLLV